MLFGLIAANNEEALENRERLVNLPTSQADLRARDSKIAQKKYKNVP